MAELIIPPNEINSKQDVQKEDIQEKKEDSIIEGKCLNE